MSAAPEVSTAFSNELTTAQRAVCRVFPLDDSGKPHGICGTGFAVHGGSYVITAAHVVSESQKCFIGIGSSCGWDSDAIVEAKDSATDVALLRLTDRAPAWLTLARDGPRVSEPLICWEDQRESKTLDESAFLLRPIGCIALGEVTLGGISTGRVLALAGRVRRGMSGGPVFAPLRGCVFGIVRATPGYDIGSVIDITSDELFSNYADDVADVWRALLEAQLRCGLGIAVPMAAVLSMEEFQAIA